MENYENFLFHFVEFYLTSDSTIRGENDRSPISVRIINVIKLNMTHYKSQFTRYVNMKLEFLYGKYTFIV